MRRVQLAVFGLFAIAAFARFSAAMAHETDKARDFETQFAAQRLDDRCHVLNAQQRHLVDNFLQRLSNDPSIRESREAFTERAGRAADSADCRKSLAFVRDAYEEAAAAQAAAVIAPVTRAMSVGRRCLAISEKDADTLAATWRTQMDEVARRYNARVRMKFAIREHAIETGSETISCRSAPAVVKAGLASAATKP